MEIEKIEHYISSITNIFDLKSAVTIEEDGVINGDYILDLAQREEQYLMSLKEKNNLETRFSLLQGFFSSLISIEMDIMYMYGKILEYDSNMNKFDDRKLKALSTNISSKELKIKKGLEYFKEYSNIIKLNIEDNEISLAILIKEHILNHFDSEFSHLKNLYGIDLLKSPLNENIKSIRKKINKSINIKELQLLIHLRESLNKKDEIEEDYLITKQSSIYRKKIKNYVFSEKYKLKMAHQVGIEDLPKVLKSKLPDENNHYKITFKPGVDEKINAAIERNFKIFNSINKNYRVKIFNNIGKFNIFKIKGNEYLVESEYGEKGRFNIAIYNYEFYKKHLIFLDGLMGNYRFGIIEGIKEEILEDAKIKGIPNIQKFAEDIDNIFYHCFDFHQDQRYEGVNDSMDRYKLLTYLPNRIFWWRLEKEKEVNNHRGNLLMRFDELLLGPDLYNSIQTRDFVNHWIDKIIDFSINGKQNMFQWINSPFMEKILGLSEEIETKFSDEKIKLKYDSLKWNDKILDNTDSKNESSHEQNQTVQKGEILQYKNYILGKGIINLEKLLEDSFPEIEADDNLLLAFEIENKSKVAIDFSDRKKYTTKDAGKFLNKLKEEYPKMTKIDFVKDIKKRIIFKSSDQTDPSEGTIKNWMNKKQE